jgi:hypothetical protein
VPSGIAYAIDDRKDFQDLGFLGASVAEVFLDRFDDCVGVVDEDSLECGEPLLSFFEVRVWAAEVCVPLKLKDALRLVFDDVDSTELSCLSHGPALLTPPRHLPQPGARGISAKACSQAL